MPQLHFHIHVSVLAAADLSSFAPHLSQWNEDGAFFQPQDLQVILFELLPSFAPQLWQKPDDPLLIAPQALHLTVPEERGGGGAP